MSLLALLSTGTTTTGRTATAAALATLRAAGVAGDATAPATAGTTISAAARIAAATRADARLDPAALAKQSRAAIDGDPASFEGMSLRALSTIAIDEGGTFTAAERRAARLEMKERDRTDLLAIIGSGLTIEALTAWQTQRDVAAADMSAEERQARSTGRW